MKTDSMRKTELGMSNYDHFIDPELEQALKEEAGQVFVHYCGWNFLGKVWWEDQFYCEVLRFGILLETIVANTLQEIMTKVSEKYGQE